MKKYFSYDRLDGELNLHETLEEAKTETEKALDYYRDNVKCDGWPLDLAGSVGYGEIKGIVTEKIIADRNDFTDEEWEEEGYNTDFDFVADYNIEELR